MCIKWLCKKLTIIKYIKITFEILTYKEVIILK